MRKTALFYGTSATKTSAVAQSIIDAFGRTDIDVIVIEKATRKDFEKYDNIIAGVSTWFDGELPTYWDEAIPEIESSDLKGKRVAIFGLGDQAGYPDNFADGIGILARVFIAAGATLAGKTKTAEYTFGHSQAQQGDEFLGLVIDIENQPDKTGTRVSQWVKQLKKEFS